MIRKIAILLAAMATLPVMAQLPSPAPQAKVDTPVTADAAISVRPAISRALLDKEDLEAWLDGFLPYALNRARIAGAVVVVVRSDGVVLEKGYGFSDVEARKPVSPDRTLFRPGSVSKLFTWTAVMQQVEAGRIDLDADVNTYLDFKIPPFAGKPLTMRDIMTHTPGFEESMRHLMSSDPKSVRTLGDVLKSSLPERVYAPGSTPAYSNYATALAGYVVERTSGMPFDDYVEKRLFAPLSMDHSSFRQPLPQNLQPLMSKGYASSTAAPKPFEFVPFAPAGSLAASGSDIGRFMMAHLNNGGALLTPATARQMHDYRAPGLGPLNTMALGFYEQQVNGHRAIGHGGDTQWFHSYLWLFPDADIGLFISLNSAGEGGGTGAIRNALFHGFADRYLPATGNTATAELDEKTTREHARLLAGKYVSSRGSFTNFLSLLGLLGQTEIVVDADGKIALPALDGLSAGPRDWVEISPFVWQDRNSGERLAAQVEDGRVVRVSVDAASPFTVLMPVPGGTDTTWLTPALLLALFLTFLAAVFWPVRALVRRHYKSDFALAGKSRLAWRLSRGFAWLVLLTVAGWLALIVTIDSDVGSIGGPTDWLIHLLRLLSPLAAIGLLASAVWHLFNTFRDKRRWTMKFGAVLLVAAGATFVWVVLQYNLYGFGLVY